MEFWKKHILIICGLIAVLVIFSLVYTFQPRELPEADSPTGKLVSPGAMYIKQLPNGQAAYISPLLGFMVAYPHDLKVSEFNDGSSSTIVFENRENGTGFQVFVIPYKDNHITEERLRMDTGGVMEERQDIVVDGIPAIMFFSKNLALGETREVWFIHNGFLYEVATYKDLDPWLSSIMKSWKFTRIGDI
jgi:hypothetical protein